MQSWVIGNWKQNPATLEEVEQLSLAVKTGLNSLTDASNTPNLMIVPCTLHIRPAVQIVTGSDIFVGCQDISPLNATTGAYTGDVSAQQMADSGVSWTLVGHSERRHFYSESNSLLLTKITHALQQGLGVVFCIGETLADYETNNTLSVVKEQLDILKNISELEEYTAKIIVAYEPVWAIGTGKVPTIFEVESVNRSIREYLTQINFSLLTTPLLYGGSVNNDNINTFANSTVIDGVLVGGASLVADKFIAIAQAFQK